MQAVMLDDARGRTRIHSLRLNMRPVGPSNPQATTERACRSSPTLVRFSALGPLTSWGFTGRAHSLFEPIVKCGEAPAWPPYRLVPRHTSFGR